MPEWLSPQVVSKLLSESWSQIVVGVLVWFATTKRTRVDGALGKASQLDKSRSDLAAEQAGTIKELRQAVRDEQARNAILQTRNEALVEAREKCEREKDRIWDAGRKMEDEARNQRHRSNDLVMIIRSRVPGQESYPENPPVPSLPAILQGLP